MSRHFVDVFEAMLGMSASVSGKTEAPPFAVRVSGTVGFAAETITGAIYVHFSEPFARRAAMAMLGLSPDNLTSPAEVNDVVGEIANMLMGGLKSWLCDLGVSCAMSAPATIRGTSFVIQPMPNVERQVLIFECDGEFVVVEIHLKLT